MHEPTEPTYHITERPCLILELPELPDEAAWKLSEFLQTLAEHVDAHYSAQILRVNASMSGFTGSSFSIKPSSRFLSPTRRSGPCPAPR